MSAIGIYYNTINIDANDNGINYIYNLKTFLAKNYFLTIAFNFDPQNLVLNKLIEVNIKIWKKYQF